VQALFFTQGYFLPVAFPKARSSEDMSRLTPARREVLAAECFELSLEGLSLREIARRKGISHPTAANLISEESTRLRRRNDDHLVRSLAAKWKVVERVWQELNGSPSSHGAANLAHALRGLLSDIDKVTGVIAPTQIQHKGQVSVVVQNALQNWYEHLNDEEVALLLMLTEKAEGGEISKDVNVVELAFERYRQHGTLKKEGPLRVLEAVPDYPTVDH
jgi:DNA-binding CsgD family transcriptional regulator